MIQLFKSFFKMATINKLPNLDTKLQAIFGLKATDIDKNPKLGLNRITDLLVKLDNPQLKLPPTIHVAGTNGKGSTVAFMRTLAQDQGLNVHSYISPHLIRFNERIIIANAEIDDTYLNNLIDHVALVNSDAPVSFFEFITAVAFLAFAQNPADILLLETGLGGRLDATNVLPQPAATIITSIGFDHIEFLGHSLAKIATEKAGIMKAGVPCFVPQDLTPDILDVFERQSAVLPCALHQVSALPHDITLGLRGAHQRQNAALAVSALQALTIKTNKVALAQTNHPARLQQLAPNIYVDGGHNAACSMTIATYLSGLNPMPLNLFFGCLNTKDAISIIQPFLILNPTIYTLDFDSSNACSGIDLAQQLNQAFNNLNVQYFGHVNQLNHRLAQQQGRVLVYGSLYLAGQLCGQFLQQTL